VSQPIPLRRGRGSTSPVTEVGYVQPADDSWWQIDIEQTPELKWPNSIEVFDRMRRQDAQVQSVLRAVMLPVQRTPWRLDPAGARDEVVELLAEDLGLAIKGQDETSKPRRGRDRFSWAEHLRNSLLMTVFGHMFFEQVYRPDETQNLLRLRKLAPRWPRSIAKINVAKDGGLDSIEQHPPAGTHDNIRLDVNRIVAYVLDREGANWLGTSLLRPAYKHWVIKDRLLRTWAQTIDRNGMGVPWYTGADPAAFSGALEDDLANGEAAAKSFRAGDSSGGAGPFGSKMELLGVKGTLPDAEKAVRYQDEQIGRSVLAHFLNLNGQGGSYALADVQAGTFFGSLNGLAETVQDTTNQHVVEDWVDLNFGPDEPAPQIVFQPIGQNASGIVDMVRVLLDSGAVFADPKLDAFMRDLVGLPPRAPLPNSTAGSSS
jgi:hypothetical protein